MSAEEQVVYVLEGGNPGGEMLPWARGFKETEMQAQLRDSRTLFPHLQFSLVKETRVFTLTREVLDV